MHFRPPIMRHIARIACLTALLAAALQGCARLGPRIEPISLPSGAPTVKDVLTDLAESQGALQGFSARGTLVLKPPDSDAVKLLSHSDVDFQPPASLYVAGRKYAHTAFRLYCQGSRFLVVMPLDQQYFYREAGEALQYYGPDASPADIAREMFLPEAWKSVSPRLSRISAFDRDSRRLEMEVFRDDVPPTLKRRLLLEGPPWVIVESRLYDRDGQVLAVTRKQDYRLHGGVRLPTELQTDFPLSNAWMRFEMGRVQVNEPMAPELFDVSGRLSEARQKGYAEVESY